MEMLNVGMVRGQTPHAVGREGRPLYVTDETRRRDALASTEFLEVGV